jgi:hypothetical protein
MATMHKTLILAAVALVTVPPAALALGQRSIVSEMPSAMSFSLVDTEGAAPLWVDSAEWPGVVRAVSDFREDIRRVTGATPEIRRSVSSRSLRTVIIGTVGCSRLIDELVARKVIDVSDIAGRWESFLLQTVVDPLAGIDHALVVAGSDKRGTIYGVYELSEQIGVSPWYWWADVPPQQRAELHVRASRLVQGEPAVRYRGIFLNDEWPNLDRWVRMTYGSSPEPGDPEATIANFNSDFYARIFELLLRLRANYLWPAMWNNAFAADDPANARLADEYGIVMGTSHQEPMMRAQKEWDRDFGRELGNWNFAEHPEKLTDFWRLGVRERASFENVYTIGLRGENDTEMVHGEAESIRLLEEIVAAQRRILAEEVDEVVSRIPQVWTLYKEVQGYYEKGLRVPDDVTLLWSDDNWGNLRRLPTDEERGRAGGAGVYYHLDYHGGPRSYQWINTSPIPKIWEQMSLAAAYGADRIWVVNVGDLKGVELPTEFFLHLAWNPDRWTHQNLREFIELWATREFGADLARETAAVVAQHTRIAGRRKPELLAPDTYSLVDYREAESVVAEYSALANAARAIYERLPAETRDAFYQLVLFPTLASAQVNELYVAAGRNALYAEQGRASATRWAERVEELFQADQDLMAFFNTDFAGGRWNHFMDQPHIGYTSWRAPAEDTLNAIPLTRLPVLEEARLGVAVEGSRGAWPSPVESAPTLPPFDPFNRQRRLIEVFNRGSEPFEYSVEPAEPWIVVDTVAGVVDDDRRIEVEIDWPAAPEGRTRGAVRVSGAGDEVVVEVPVFNPATPTRETLDGFVEADGYISIEAEHVTRSSERPPRRWIRIEDYGQTLSGMRSDGPASAPSATPGQDSPNLGYRMYLFTPGEVTVSLVVAPSLNVAPDRGLRVAVSLDDAEPAIVEIVPAGYTAENGNLDWERSVMDGFRTVTTSHEVADAGYHTLTVWMVDPAVVVQKIVVETASARETASYLGPPESFRNVLER